jgi:hypothetical protein
VTTTTHISAEELHRMFGGTSYGPLVEPFPNWPGLWHRRSAAADYIRAVDRVRDGMVGDIRALIPMARQVPHGGRIQPPSLPVIPVQRSPLAVEFPEWVR